MMMICSFCKEPLVSPDVKHDIYDCKQHIDAEFSRLRAELETAVSERDVAFWALSRIASVSMSADDMKKLAAETISEPDKHLADCEG
jgi:hypothetical protein